jgi:hypothetical protein
MWRVMIVTQRLLILALDRRKIAMVVIMPRHRLRIRIDPPIARVQLVAHHAMG